MAFRKLVGSYKDYNLSTHVIEDGYLAVDVDSGSLRIGDGVTPGGTEVGGGSSTSLGDLTATGSTLSAPSNGDLTLQTAGTGVVIINDTFKNRYKIQVVVAARLPLIFACIISRCIGL